MSDLINLALIPGYISRDGGGVAEVSKNLSKKLFEKKELLLDVYGIATNNDRKDLAEWESVNLSTFPIKYFHWFAYVPQMLKAIEQ